MKKKYLITVAIAVVAIIVVLVVTNPFAPGNVGVPNGSHNSTSGTNSTTNSTNQKPSGGTNWISPGKIYIDGYEPGQTVIIELEIYNANSVDATFSVDYRYPDSLLEGYSKPAGAGDWVRPKEKFPVIPAHETYTAKIWLHMPSDAEIPGDKWEFWIGVIDKSQTGMIITELAARVLVTMK